MGQVKQWEGCNWTTTDDTHLKRMPSLFLTLKVRDLNKSLPGLVNNSLSITLSNDFLCSNDDMSPQLFVGYRHAFGIDDFEE